MASSPVNENGGGGVSPPPFARPLTWLTDGLNLVGAAWTFGLMLLVSVDVIGRTVFSHPIVGVTEIVSFSIVCIVFLQLGRTVELGRVTRADTFLDAIQRVSPTLSALLAFVAEFAGAILMAIIVYGVWPRMISDYESNYFIGTPGLFTFPSWPVQAAVVTGAAIAGLHFLIRAIAALIAAFKRPPNGASR